MPTIEWHLLNKSIPIYAIKSIASWYVFLCKVASNDVVINYVDPEWNMLTPLLNKGDEEGFASSSFLWGDVPKKYPDFVNTLVEEMQLMGETYNIRNLDSGLN
jgi:hypothetical protein